MLYIVQQTIFKLLTLKRCLCLGFYSTRIWNDQHNTLILFQHIFNIQSKCYVRTRMSFIIRSVALFRKIA